MVISLFIVKLSQINKRPLSGWACAILTRYTNAFDRTMTSQFGVPPDIRDFTVAKNTSFTGCDITMGHTATHGPPPEVCSTLLATPASTCSTRVSITDNGQMLMFRPLWIHLARLVDRLCFVIILVIEIIAVVVIVVASIIT